MDAQKIFEVPELLTLDGRPATGADNEDDEAAWSCSGGCGTGTAPHPTQPAPQG